MAKRKTIAWYQGELGRKEWDLHIATLSRDRIMAHRDNLEKKLTESDKACAIWAVCAIASMCINGAIILAHFLS